MKELDVKGYEGLYKITEDGQVRSIGRVNVDKNGKSKFYNGRTLNQTTLTYNHTSYKAVTLSKEGKTKRWQVHRLVALTFIPNTENKPIVNHIDNNGLNNHYSNLEWCTHSENMKHAQTQGRLFYAQSKGGTVGGYLRKEHYLAISDNYLNTKVNDWYIMEYDRTKNKKYVLAKCCLCDTVKSVYLSTITTGYSKHCKPCGTKQKTVYRKKLQFERIKNTIINDMFVLDSGHYRKCDNKFVVDLECTVCGKIKRQPLSLILKGKVTCNHIKSGRKKI